MEMRLQSITQRHKSTGWRVAHIHATGVGGGLTYSPTKNEEKKAQKVKKKHPHFAFFPFFSGFITLSHTHSLYCMSSSRGVGEY